MCIRDRELDDARLLRYNDALVLAWRQRTLSAARECIATTIGDPDEYAEGGFGNSLVFPMTSILTGSYWMSIVDYFGGVSSRRMTAVALAIRLYELDHGRRPATLTELVPGYLPHVPDDPFAAKGVKLRYAPDARRALLYSVGVNGQDDGGSLELYEALEDAWEDDGDITFFLDGDRPVGECDWKEPDERKNAYRTIPIPSRVGPRGVVKLSPPIVATPATATSQPTSRPQPGPAR